MNKSIFDSSIDARDDVSASNVQFCFV